MSGIVLTADTLVGSPTTGEIEYNGFSFYGTPAGAQRGVLPAAQYYRLNAGHVGSNVNTAQSVFGVGVTLTTNTVYAFEGVYLLSKTAGATTHTVGTGFGGTATITNIGYNAEGYLGSANPIVGTNAQSLIATSATATAVTTTVASATMFATLMVKGTVSITGGGTLIPQYILSAAPGGAYTTLTGSYFMIYPISSGGANTSVGVWT